MHWVRDTDDVRELLTLLPDALEILVKGGIDRDTIVKFPSSVSGITVMYYYQQNNISKPNYLALLKLQLIFDLVDIPVY